MTSPIYFRTQKITSSFQRLEEISSNQQLDLNPFETVTHDEIIDVLERFKIWAGNIGAFQSLDLKSSLDYRLRDTPSFTAQIAKLLDKLTQALENGVSNSYFVSSTKHNNAVDCEANEVRGGDSDSDTSEEQSEIREIYGSIIDGISNLFRFSMIIRRNTPRDRYAKAAAAAAAKGYVFDEGPDTRYVMDKFSAFDAGKKTWLANRLGKAIAQRRQYLRYCEDHDLAMKLGGEQEATSRPKTDAPTQASTLLLAPGRIPEYDDVDETQSQTSFATTIDNHSSNRKLQVVQLEVARKGLNPFPCPYCHQIKVIDTQKAWKRHVLSDLKPYVCAFENCQLRMFPDRHTWFSHELKEHRREWKCQFCSHSAFKSALNFESHLKHSHAASFIDAQLPSLLEMGQQSIIQISPRDCPFCDHWEKRLRKLNPNIPSRDALVVTPSQYKHHVGGHMEQLALFAIPRGHTETGDAGSNGSNDSAPGLASRDSSRSDYSSLHFEELDANAKEVGNDRQWALWVQEQEKIEAARKAARKAARQAAIETKIKKLEDDLAFDIKKLRDEAAAEQKKLKEEAAAEAAKLEKEADEEAESSRKRRLKR
ncbi:hypothetical protein B0J14DRAFT_474333 [Halenospora varia]|nr:hypothetical protein B0J14DRAFT_474333 [Halenospora varia]